MGYPLDLDEYDEARLVAELRKRRALRELGFCDYCGRPYNTPSCKFPDRHKAATPESADSCDSSGTPTTGR